MDTVAGPVAGTAGELVQLASNVIHGQGEWGDAARLVMDNAPFINLFYTRAALDWLLLFHIREMISPGTLARTERRMKEEYNQHYIVPPSSIIQRGGGFR